jgi:hypothetical protein
VALLAPHPATPKDSECRNVAQHKSRIRVLPLSKSNGADTGAEQIREESAVSKLLHSRATGAVLTAAIVGLTLATAYIHFSLGGLLFTLNATGYAVAAVAILVGAATPMALIRRFSWLPRLGLVGYTATTIAAYMVMGPYFTLGWIAKGIEVALIGLLVIDIVRVYGSPFGLVRAAVASVAPILPDRFRPQSA